MKKAGRQVSQEGERTRQMQVKFFRMRQNSAGSGNTVTVVSNTGRKGEGIWLYHYLKNTQTWDI